LAAVTSLIAALLASGLAGCSSGNDSASKPASAGQGQRDLAGDGGDSNQKATVPLAGKEQAPAQAEAELGAKAEVRAPDQPLEDSATTGRSIVYTGSMTRRVDDVNRAAAEASTIVTGAGGFVAGDQRTVDARHSRTTLTLRVPAARFSAVLDSLAKMAGKEESRDVGARDVTEQVTDLNSRVTTARASVNRVRELLARAQTINEIISLESELSRREADLESLQARLRRLEDLTALSTITLVLLGPDAESDTKPDPDEGGFASGLKDGWHALTSSLVVLLTVLGAMLPWLVTLAIPVSALLWFRRRKSQRGQVDLSPEPRS
jgi:hypothetical protein